MPIFMRDDNEDLIKRVFGDYVFTSITELTDCIGIPEIKDVIFHNPATIVKWTDGTKTVVKCDRETYDKEKGLAMAIIKKINGNKGNYNDIFRKWCPEEYED